MPRVLEAQCSTQEQNWGQTTISLLKVFILYLLEKVFDLNLIKTGAAAYLSFAQSLQSGTMYGTWQCYCIKERRTLAFYKTLSPIFVIAVYILSSKKKVHMNSLASLKQLCVSPFLKKSWRTLFSMFYWLAYNLLGNCRKRTNKWSSCNLAQFENFFSFVTSNTCCHEPTITKAIQTSKAFNVFLTYLF